MSRIKAALYTFALITTFVVVPDAIGRIARAILSHIHFAQEVLSNIAMVPTWVLGLLVIIASAAITGLIYSIYEGFRYAPWQDV